MTDVKQLALNSNNEIIFLEGEKDADPLLMDYAYTIVRESVVGDDVRVPLIFAIKDLLKLEDNLGGTVLDGCTISDDVQSSLDELRASQISK